MSTVRSLPGKWLEPRNFKINFKHGGGHVMVWTCVSANEVGPFHKIYGIVDRFVHKEILEAEIISYAEWNMLLWWVFQHDNDPKHTPRVVKYCMEENAIQVLDGPAQSPDLSSIENLFGVLKKSISGKRFKDRNELFQALETE